MSSPNRPTLSSIETDLHSPSSSKARTLATRLPPDEVRAVEEAAQAAGRTSSAWLREAALAHLKRPSQKQKPLQDPTLLAELLALRSVVINLLSVANPQLGRETVQKIVAHADSVKASKADEMLRRMNDGSEEA